MYQPLSRNWLEAPECSLLTALLSAPILSVYEAEGFSDELWTCICAITGFYHDDPTVRKDEKILASAILAEIGRHCQNARTNIVDMLDDDTDGSIRQQLSNSLARIYQVRPAEVIADYFEESNVDVATFLRYIAKVETDTSISPGFFINLLYRDAHPVVCSLAHMLDEVFIMPSGGLNYGLIIEIEKRGYKYKVVERDCAGPTRCELTLKKGKIYHG